MAVISFLIPLMVIGFILSVAVYIIRTRAYIIRTNKERWNSIPSIDEYKVKNPDCITNKGMKCAVCNSTSIKSLGFSHAESTNRFFICNHCGTELYRTNN
jgi:hypothetical protein